MKCRHKYFTHRDGELVCSECGKPASEVKEERIEDKMRGPQENKAPDVIPPGQFWCPKCHALHRETSRVGKNHLKHLA